MKIFLDTANVAEIRDQLLDELNRLRQRIAVQVTTATPLNENLRNRITQRLQAMFGSEVKNGLSFSAIGMRRRSCIRRTPTATSACSSTGS